MQGAIDNGLGLAVTSENLYTINSEVDLRGALPFSESPIVLGDATNVILTSDLKRPVLLIRNRGLDIEFSSKSVMITCAAGESWDGLVRSCLSRSIYGLENLSLIPGTVGAAPIQNIGAYGVELSESFVKLSAMNLSDGSITVFNKKDLEFGYRDSIFKRDDYHRYVILNITLKLLKKPKINARYPELQQELSLKGPVNPQPVDVARAVRRIRRRKLPDPKVFGNVGSFFKNPIISAAVMRELRAAFDEIRIYKDPYSKDIKVSAAQLIDLAGLKKASVGSARVWNHQPLVLYNAGGATSSDFVGLANLIASEVKELFGIELQLEPTIYF